MTNTVTYNGVTYDVEKVIMFKGLAAKAAIETDKQVNMDTAVECSELKFPMVIPINGDSYHVLLKPTTFSKNKKVAYVLSKFVLKKLKSGYVPEQIERRLSEEVVNPISTTRKLTGIELLRAKVEQQNTQQRQNNFR